MRILIVKTSALGDIVHTFPVLAYLRDRVSGPLVIDWVVEARCAGLVDAHPLIDNVYTVDTRAWKHSLFSKKTWDAVGKFRREIRHAPYDVVFDLQGNTKSGLITATTRARSKVGFARSNVSEWPNLIFTYQHYDVNDRASIRSSYLDVVRAYFEDPVPYENIGVKLNISSEESAEIQDITRRHSSDPSPKILVCPGSAWENKRLPDDVLRDFLKEVQKELGCRFLFAWGSKEELGTCQELATHLPHSETLPKLSLRVLQNLMSELDLVVAMDSLPLHLAGSAGTPTFGLFGPSSAAKYMPEGPQHGAYQGSCPYGKTFKKRCPILRTCKTGACLRHKTSAQVSEAFHKWWKVACVGAGLTK